MCSVSPCAACRLRRRRRPTLTLEQAKAVPIPGLPAHGQHPRRGCCGCRPNSRISGTEYGGHPAAADRGRRCYVPAGVKLRHAKGFRDVRSRACSEIQWTRRAVRGSRRRARWAARSGVVSFGTERVAGDGVGAAVLRCRRRPGVLCARAPRPSRSKSSPKAVITTARLRRSVRSFVARSAADRIGARRARRVSQRNQRHGRCAASKQGKKTELLPRHTEEVPARRLPPLKACVGLPAGAAPAEDLVQDAMPQEVEHRELDD